MFTTHVFVILVISRFGYEGWIWVLIASFPDLCILFTLFFSNQLFYFSDQLYDYCTADM